MLRYDEREVLGFFFFFLIRETDDKEKAYRPISPSFHAMANVYWLGGIKKQIDIITD